MASEHPKARALGLLTAAILGAAYFIYLVIYFFSAMSDASSGAASLGAAMASAMVAPHAAFAGLGALFSILGWAMNSRPFALTSGILFAVAIVLFPYYFWGPLLPMIGAFVGFARLPQNPKGR